MASITIRKLDDTVKAYLRLRSASNGRSVEEEVRVILGELIQGRPEQPGHPATARSSPRGASQAGQRYRRSLRYPDHRRRHCGLQVARPDPAAEGASHQCSAAC